MSKKSSNFAAWKKAVVFFLKLLKLLILYIDD